SPPITSCPGAAAPTVRALRSAFSRTTSSAGPLSRSPTPAGRASNAMPSCVRIARRCGEAEARINTPSSHQSSRNLRLSKFRNCSELGEEQPDLALRGAGGIGAVHEVEGDLARKVAADGAGCGLERVGRADQLPRGLD